MECKPTVSAAVETVAVPPLSAEVPRVVAPSLKVTVIVGVPDPFGVTVAVNITDCPKLEEFKRTLLLLWLGSWKY